MNKETVLVDTNSRFDGGLLGLIGINIAYHLIGILTLGIGLPWAIVLKYKWRLSHTVYNGRVLKFDGTGGQLIGSYLLWLLLSIITIGIYAFFIPVNIRQWKVKNTHFVDNKKVGDSEFTGRVIGLLGTNILCALLILLTLTLALPSAIAIKQRWETDNTIIDGFRLRFTGRGIGLFGNYVKWILLTIITLSIYVLWIPIKFEKWKVTNTELVNPLTQKYHIKYSNEWYEERYTNSSYKTKFTKENRVFSIVIITLASLIILSNIYFLIQYKVIFLNMPTITILLVFFFILIYGSDLFLLVSGIALLLLGCIGIKTTSPKSSSFRGLMIFAYAVVILQPLPMIGASLIYLSTISQSYIISMALLWPVMIFSNVFFWISITFIIVFAKKLSNSISENNSNKITTNKELSKYVVFAMCLVVLSLLVAITTLIITGVQYVMVMVFACSVNVIIMAYIYFRTIYALPIHYRMSISTNPAISDSPARAPIVTPPVVESSHDRIDRALGTSYKSLFVGELNDEKSSIGLKAIEEAIELGSITAYSQLGAYYEDINEYDKAFKSYFKGYELGSRYAPYFIARMYEEGRGVGKDDFKAYEWHVKAADSGNSVSQFHVAVIFKQGKVVEKDLQKALHYFTLASESGDFDAALLLGLNYRDGGELVDVDASVSEKYLLNAVKNATDDEEKGNAYNELSILYLGCLGEKPSSREFLNHCVWFMNAAVKLGDVNAIANSKKADGIIRIDARAKGEVARMSEPTTPILPPDFYKESGKNVLRPSMNAENNSVAIVAPISDHSKTKLEEESDGNNNKKKPVNAHKNRKSGLRQGISDGEVAKLNGIVNGFLLSLIIKIILFGIGLGIILYFRANIETYGILTTLFFIIGVIIAGLPGLFKSYSNSINISKKVDRFFGAPEYKGTIDSDGNVRIKENTDWMFVILNTLLNLVYYAALAPLEFLLGIIKVIIYKRRIKIYWENKGQ